MQRQMGGVGYAMNSGRQINVMNPASYAAIDSLTFLFDMGVNANSLWSSETVKGTTTRAQSWGGGVDYVTMQFPLGRHFGASMGLVPYSQVGYAFGKEIKHGALENNGTGGINQAYLGLSGRLAGFSVGANASYDFGNIINDIFTTPVSGGQTKFEHVMRVRNFNVTAGAQYTARWDRFHKMVVGATYSPRLTMHGESWVTQQELNVESLPDTIVNIGLKDRYYYPESFGGGISYSYDRNTQFTIEGDVTYQKWSNASYQALSISTDKGGFVDKPVTLAPGQQFFDRTKFALGGSIVPNIRGNYLQRMSYRLGAYYCNDYLNIVSGGKSNQVKDMGLTCGFGFPTPEGKTMINLGFEWKHRATSPVNLISENYLNVTLGLNFNELWFWQRKIR